jgi:hypothetical protein
VDELSATTLPTSNGNPFFFLFGGIGQFQTIQSAAAGEVLRGVAFAPGSQQ